MYTPHDVCELPPLDTKIWRYMSISKFRRLIESSSQYFCRLDKLGDQKEGLVPNNTIRWWEDQINSGRYRDQTIDSLHDFIKYLHQWIRPTCMVNCWQIFDYESSTMWAAYGKNNTGVAIQSTVGNLVGAFVSATEDIFIGKVKYFSPNRTMLTMSNTMLPSFNKQVYYQNEFELRAMIEEYSADHKPIHNNGKNVKVILNTLIESVCLSPNASECTKKTVEKILRKSALMKSVYFSEISDTWINGPSSPYYHKIINWLKNIFK
jgi:hypothetical protein